MYNKIIPKRSLPLEYKKLLDSAAEAMKFAYMSYSKESVGAALLGSKGEIITGAKVEKFGRYPGICAEGAALNHAKTLSVNTIKAIAVIGARQGNDFFDTDEIDLDLVYPCRSFRERVFKEFMLYNHSLDIIMSSPDSSNVIIKQLGVTSTYSHFLFENDTEFSPATNFPLTKYFLN